MMRYEIERKTATSNTPIVIEGIVPGLSKDTIIQQPATSEWSPLNEKGRETMLMEDITHRRVNADLAHLESKNTLLARKRKSRVLELPAIMASQHEICSIFLQS